MNHKDDGAAVAPVDNGAEMLAEAIARFGMSPEAQRRVAAALRTEKEEFSALVRKLDQTEAALREAREEVAGLRSALERLGSMEAFVRSRIISRQHDDELVARIDFARWAARFQPATPSPVPLQPEYGHPSPELKWCPITQVRCDDSQCETYWCRRSPDSRQPEAGSSGASAEDVERARALRNSILSSCGDAGPCVLPPCTCANDIAAALSATRAEKYAKGERAGLERAAQHVEANDCYTSDFGAGKALADEIRALPPAALETK